MSRSTVWILGSLALIAAFLTVSASGEPVPIALRGTALESALLRLGWTNAIAFNLSTGYLVSLFFWYLVVLLPERRRRRILRLSLQRTYDAVREQLVQTLLWASDVPHNTETVTQLATNAEKFRRFFSENQRDKWYAALNGLQGSRERLGEIAYALDSLSNEVSYVLGTTPLHDEKLHSFLKLLNENVRRLKYYESQDYDQVKYIGTFVWSLIGNWSMISGPLEEDIVQTMIKRL